MTFTSKTKLPHTIISSKSCHLKIFASTLAQTSKEKKKAEIIGKLKGYKKEEIAQYYCQKPDDYLGACKLFGSAETAYQELETEDFQVKSEDMEKLANFYSNNGKDKPIYLAYRWPTPNEAYFAGEYGKPENINYVRPESSYIKLSEYMEHLEKFNIF